MVRVLERLGDQPIHSEVVRQVRDSTSERYVHGAQFVTEIQGGSDVGANVVKAQNESGRWTLHGQKWFCSNINADYFLVTGRPTGAPSGPEGVALFLVPAYRDQDRRYRNGYTIDRLKDKLGTCELATAEVTFDGARAYPVGPLDRGLPNLVAHVLVPSRLACVNMAAASLRRAERIAGAYTDFRSAFSKKLNEYPLVRHALDELRTARERSLGAVIELIRMWQSAEERANETVEALDFRYLLSLCKPVLTRNATRLLNDAIMLLGANGVEERFSPLPRLWRDAIVMETWEGPHNVLLAQALRDMTRFEVEPATFVERTAGEPRPDLARELANIIRAPRDPASTVAFARWAPKLVEAFGDRVRQDTRG
jgi:alkylation response protein AidB-like acyl-CoA dehydrogenase